MEYGPKLVWLRYGGLGFFEGGSAAQVGLATINLPQHLRFDAWTPNSSDLVCTHANSQQTRLGRRWCK